jgi:dolichol-phosphate mannosyltransferase
MSTCVPVVIGVESTADKTVELGPRCRSRVLIVLPAYNEERNIAALVQSLDEAMADAYLPYEVIVIDDGSCDRTLEVLARCARDLPLTVAKHEHNQGLGATIRDGLTLAARKAHDSDIIITMDADATHTPGLIRRMVQMIHEGHHVVIASRYRHGSRTFGVPLHRRALSYAASWLFRTLFPIPGVRDYTCGYRAYRASILKSAISTFGDGFVNRSGFEAMVDILMNLRRLPVAVFGEVPMILRYDLKGGASKMRVTRTAVQTLILIGKRRFGIYG